MLKPLLTPETVAAILTDVPPADVVDLAQRGELAGVEIRPGVWRFARVDVTRFINARRRGYRRSTDRTEPAA
jgi:hypothetical protein